MLTSLVLVLILVLCVLYYFWCKNQTVYLDNNATTQPYPEVLTAVKNHSCHGNASSHGNHQANAILSEFRETVLRIMGISRDLENVIITSGASESNNLFLRACVEAHAMQPKSQASITPNIVIGMTEHKTSLECVKQLERVHKIEIRYVQPRMDGSIDPMEVAYAIDNHTLCVSVMHVNNETGVINRIDDIAKVARHKNVLLHVDAVQSFAKLHIPQADAVTMSFHKIYGPVGVGALVLSDRARAVIATAPQICGTQNSGMRGGTENIAAIAGCTVAMRITAADRDKKNAHLANLKSHMIKTLHTHFDITPYENFAGQHNNYDPYFMLPGWNGRTNIVILGEHTVPWTLLISFVKQAPLQSHMCNIALQNYLASKKIIVSTGSACQTKYPSHVLTAMGVPFIVRSGVIRVSFGDHNSMSDVQSFCDAVAEYIQSSASMSATAKQ
jgi:cysteine desulfurase